MVMGNGPKLAMKVLKPNKGSLGMNLNIGPGAFDDGSRLAQVGATNRGKAIVKEKVEILTNLNKEKHAAVHILEKEKMGQWKSLFVISKGIQTKMLWCQILKLLRNERDILIFTVLLNDTRRSFRQICFIYLKLRLVELGLMVLLQKLDIRILLVWKRMVLLRNLVLLK
ncbi:hypothetical protein Golax_016453 [Gossypium laxum]|uniref:Uncharacterized protein n=1 Tax=Gossypium laxum TaxID=34288 RepID=A0A7J8YX55_9ROSI|nr:hypothetical protein [Gossypium laxum]